MDLTGITFGKLKVLKRTNKRYNYNYYYLCECECGNKKLVLDRSLLSGNTKSCGCIQRAKIKEIGTIMIKNNSRNLVEFNKKNNTNISSIKNKIPKNNISGKKGIWFDKERNKWQAYIQIHNKRINLGRFTNKDEAIHTREEAEKKYFKPILDKNKIRQ